MIVDLQPGLKTAGGIIVQIGRLGHWAEAARLNLNGSFLVSGPPDWKYERRQTAHSGHSRPGL